MPQPNINNRKILVDKLSLLLYFTYDSDVSVVFVFSDLNKEAAPYERSDDIPVEPRL